MRSIVIGCALVSISLTLAGFVQSGDGKDAGAIIARAITAGGGETNLAKCDAMTWTEKGTYYGMGDGLPYNAKLAVQGATQFSMEIEGVFTMIVDGKRGWTKAGPMVKEMTKDELALNLHNQKAGWMTSLLPLRNKAFQLTVLADAEVNKQPAQVVKVTRKDYPTVTLYFGKDKGMLLKSEFKTKAPEMNNKDVTQAMYFSDYRDVQGAKVAHKMVVKRDDKVFIEAELSNLRTHGKLDAKVFAKPAE